METPVTAKTALLQVLLEGRGYGSELADRVAQRTQGRITLSQGSLYPALQKFEKAGLVASYDEEGDGKKDDHTGRPRIYYQLTEAGITEATAHRQMLAQLIGVESLPELAAQPAVDFVANALAKRQRRRQRKKKQKEQQERAG